MATSNQIRMTPDHMRDRASQYNNEAEEVKNVITKLDSLINELQSEWEGGASESFAKQFYELRPSFTNMQELLLTIARQLQQTAGAYEENDKALASQYGVK